MIELTQKQYEVLLFIEGQIKEKSISPTLKEIAEAFGVTQNAIKERVNGLVRKGALSDSQGRSRSMVPVQGTDIYVGRR